MPSIDGANAMAATNNNEHELLRRIWVDMKSNSVPTAFVGLDTEFMRQGICELGIATKHNDDPIVARHIIVNSIVGTRSRPLKPFEFGKSEAVHSEAELVPILVASLAYLQRHYQVVVLVGHDIQGDLRNLRQRCGWVPPRPILILDTQRIWRSWLDVPAMGTLEQSLNYFNLLGNNRHHLHNAGNDAKYTLELLVCEAAQAVRVPILQDRTIRQQNHAASGSDQGKKRKRGEPENAPTRRPVGEPLDDGTRKRIAREAQEARARVELAKVNVIDLTADSPPRGLGGLLTDPIDLTDDSPTLRPSKLRRTIGGDLMPDQNDLAQNQDTEQAPITPEFEPSPAAPPLVEPMKPALKQPAAQATFSSGLPTPPSSASDDEQPIPGIFSFPIPKKPSTDAPQARPPLVASIGPRFIASGVAFGSRVWENFAFTWRPNLFGYNPFASISLASTSPGNTQGVFSNKWYHNMRSMVKRTGSKSSPAIEAPNPAAPGLGFARFTGLNAGFNCTGGREKKDQLLNGATASLGVGSKGKQSTRPDLSWREAGKSEDVNGDRRLKLTSIVSRTFMGQ